MSKLKYRIAYYAVLHFLMDFLCAAFVTGTLVQNGADLYTVLIYNLCAFALQFVVGALFDVRGISSGGAVAAFFVLTASFVLKDIPYAAAAAAGIGNSLFHVGAGRDILLRDRKNCTPLGIFICPGAVGIFLGVIAGNGHLISLWVLGILAAAGAFFAWQVYRQNPGPAAGNEPAEAGTSGTHAAAVPASGFRPAAVLIPLLCLLAVVILRSYMGAHQDFAWKKTSIRQRLRARGTGSGQGLRRNLCGQNRKESIFRYFACGSCCLLCFFRIGNIRTGSRLPLQYDDAGHDARRGGMAAGKRRNILRIPLIRPFPGNVP
jgi:hypothetical protein